MSFSVNDTGRLALLNVATQVSNTSNNNYSQTRKEQQEYNVGFLWVDTYVQDGYCSKDLNSNALITLNGSRNALAWSLPF